MVGNSHEPGNHEHHPPHLAHHFDTTKQQFESGKMGMWLFLATEILLFGGLFCAYAIYRSNHPEIFIYAHKYLDVTLGAINTAVLICSSLTMALAVRSAQLSHQKNLILFLSVTLFFGIAFWGIKSVEYKHKWQHGLKWGKEFNPDPEYLKGGLHENQEIESAAPHANEEIKSATSAAISASTAGITEVTPAENSIVPPTATTNQPSVHAIEKSTIEPAAEGPKGLASEVDEYYQHIQDVPENVHLFFGIYFVMTGLHALHVIVGMGLIAWMIFRSTKGHFGKEYFTPVDLTGLYWHLVDLIWIYLFPLLYLIH